MTENASIQIIDNSSEKIALDLLRIIATCEGKSFSGRGQSNMPDKKYILDTYAKILLTIKDHLRRFNG